MEARDKRIIGKALAVINHHNTSDDEAVASFRAIRRIGLRLGLPLETVVAGGEAERWRRAYERLAAARMAAANATRTRMADDYAKVVAMAIQRIRRERPDITTDGIAEELEKRKVRTAWGKKTWTRMQVHRAMKRIGKW